ncbi:MAG: chaperonin family protein RbcX [Elainellaceae cyanobacterium]
MTPSDDDLVRAELSFCPYYTGRTSFHITGPTSPMDLKQIAKDTAKTVTSYLTYRAIRTVVAQLRETNPALSMWLHNFSSTNKIQDGEVYLRELLRENQALAFRIMTVRAHLADEITEFLPEMVCSGIQQANMEHRRQYLERITQLDAESSSEALGEPVQRPDVASESDPSDGASASEGPD